MNCPKCNFKVKRKDKFCPYCGHELKEEVIETIAIEQEEEAEKEKISSTKEEQNKERICSAIAYLGFLFFIPLLACPDSKYAKFHANQGIILCIFNAILSAISGISIIINSFKINIIEIIVDTVILLYSVYGVYNAVTGREKKLPLIGKFNIIN